MSSGSVDADVNIILRADDQASGTVDSATKSINANWKQMNDVQRAAGREFQVNHSQLFALGRAMTATGRIVDHSISLFNSYNLMQLRLETATQNTADAQERLAQAIAQYGPNSTEAIKAAKDLKKVQDEAKKASDEARIQFALMVASAVAQSGTLVTTVIPRLLALRTALFGVSAAEAAATVGAAGPVAGLAGKAAAGAGFGATLAKAAPKLVKIGGAAAIGVSMATMMGEQQAGETSVPSGLEALGQVGGDIYRTLTNIFHIQSTDPKQAADEVSKILSLQNTAGG